MAPKHRSTTARSSTAAWAWSIETEFSGAETVCWDGAHSPAPAPRSARPARERLESASRRDACKPSSPLPGSIARWVMVWTLTLTVALVALLAPLTFGPPVKAAPARPARASSSATKSAGPPVRTTSSVASSSAATGASPSESSRPGAVRATPNERRRRSGRLALEVRPWGHVWLDGRHVGTTPLLPLRIRPGKHVVVVENPALRQSRTLRVRARPGRTSRVIVDLTPVRAPTPGEIAGDAALARFAR